ncbi:hypothetical protein ACFL04_04060 [Patescibacteria group bacterium]
MTTTREKNGQLCTNCDGNCLNIKKKDDRRALVKALALSLILMTTLLIIGLTE